MQLEGKIAWRYLWGKKSMNAINIVSGVSAAAVAVVTAAMICIMSIMNGFGGVIENMFSQIEPDLRIIKAHGTYFSTNTAAFHQIRKLPCVGLFNETIEETGLVEFDERQIVAQIKGVDTTFCQLTNINSTILDGQFKVQDNSFYYAVMGVGLSTQLQVGAHYIHPLHIYAPKRTEQVNMVDPAKNFNQRTCYMAGVFAVNQIKYDNHVMLVSLPLARQLFEYDEHTVTAVELQINGSVQDAKQQLEQILGSNYLVQDRYEQQADFFHILRIEKWLTTLLLVFVLLIASFNIIGSLTMLILDKKNDIRILHNLGANTKQIRRIFLFEGWLVSIVGSIIGLILGVTLCGIQEHYGIIKLGNGSQFVLSSYPVKVEYMDLLWVVLIVLAIGFVAAWYPAKHISKHIKE